MSYAAVFPLVRTRAFAGAFDYSVPPELVGKLEAGALVAVQLGSQTVIGVVLELRLTTHHEGRVLPVRDVLDVPAIPHDLLELASEVESYYLTSFSAALSLVCPPTGAFKVVRQYELTTGGRAAREAGEEGLDEVAGLKLPAGPLTKLGERYRRKGWVRVAYRVYVVGAVKFSRELRRGGETPPRLGPRQRAALELVEQSGVLDERSLRAATGLSLPALKRLLEAGALDEVADASEAVPGLRSGAGATAAGGEEPAAPPPVLAQVARLQACAHLGDAPDLLPEQRHALHAILCEARPGDEVLVHGVTGSGKTEIYLQAAQAALEGGRSVLLLVPEIGLTGQTVARVRERFAGQEVAVLHSGLTARERLLSYRAVARGEVRIVVGARSAVFAPLRDLGLIVVDEEHDTSYKQESEPAYDARTVARWRAARSGAVVVLGSATPSVESYARVPLHLD
ncbi:MAG TPA: DEAD/DEAH box helicase, partial [Thermoleophilia bacterium]